MKDIHITGKRIRTELIWLLACFIAAVIYNAYAIMRHKMPWSELLTSLHAVVILALIIYLLSGFIRGLVALVIRFSTKKR